MIFVLGKAQNTEEKFKKIKDVYAKLRDEHIETLKKLATLQKDVEVGKRNVDEASAGKQVNKIISSG